MAIARYIAVEIGATRLDAYFLTGIVYSPVRFRPAPLNRNDVARTMMAMPGSRLSRAFSLSVSDHLHCALLVLTDLTMGRTMWDG